MKQVAGFLASQKWLLSRMVLRLSLLNEGLRKEYARSAYQAQEALRQKVETDPKAREAYRALGGTMMGW